jgi:hypothetical protein
MPQVHHEWLAKWSRELVEEYEPLHRVAADDRSDLDTGARRHGDDYWRSGCRLPMR